jgi:hypothetical protein
MFSTGCTDSSSASKPMVQAPPVQHNHIEPSLQAGIKAGPKPKTPVVLNNGFDPSKQVAVASDTGAPSATSPADAAESDDPDAGINPDQYRARKRIASEIGEALKLRKTLVVWVIDKTSASSDVRNWAVGRFSRIARDAMKKAKPGVTLSMAVVSYGGDVNFLNNDPVDAAQAESLAGALPSETDNSPLTFTAVNQAADKFLPFRSQGYEMLMVIVANNTGRDWDQLDAAIPKLRRKAVPVFGVGNAVPFNRQWHGEQRDNGPPADLRLDSCELEGIDLALPQGQGDADLMDSGYGPFGLERLCRGTHGEFLRFRNGSTSFGWTLSGDGTISQEMLRRYAPDYVSPEQYKAILSANRACQALHNAARLPRAEQVMAYLTSRFTQPSEKQGGAAQLAKMIGNAQMKAAEKSPEVDRIYEALASGKADRAKITSPRWQAEFDLAMGRILAAKARIDGYNAQLAVIKQGKAFKEATHNTWILHPSDSISAGSALDKMAKDSTMYLKRVITEHGGTPWAEMARREMMELPGWAWTEQ